MFILRITPQVIAAKNNNGCRKSLIIQTCRIRVHYLLVTQSQGGNQTLIVPIGGDRYLSV